MAIEIKNHSDGTIAEVTPGHQLMVRSEARTLDHQISWADEDVYSIEYVDTGITAKTQTILHIRNTSAVKRLVIASAHMQAVTDTADKPVVGEYWEVGVGRTYASGGTLLTSANLNRISGKVSSTVIYGNDPTMAGTFVPLGRHYNLASQGDWVYEENEALILGLNDTFEIRLTSTGTGEAVAEVNYFLMEITR